MQSLFLALMAFVGVGLMALAYHHNRPSMAIAASMVFIVDAVLAYSLHTVGTWDAYYGAFWTAVLLSIVCILEGITLRPRPDQLTEEERAQDDTETDPEDTDYDRWRKRVNQRRVRRDSRRASPHYSSNGRDDEFARTGKM